jgi:hypothetical protein
LSFLSFFGVKKIVLNKIKNFLNKIFLLRKNKQNIFVIK